MRTRRLLVVLTLVAVAAIAALPGAAQNPQAGIVVRDSWARSSEGSNATAVYLTIVNRGDNDDALLGATSPVADRVVIERLSIKDLKATRRTLGSLPIKAGRIFEMKPSDTYLAVTGLQEPLRPGQTLTIVLRFAGAGQIEVTVEATNQELGNRGR